jgi:hypothetical protein
MGRSFPGLNIIRIRDQSAWRPVGRLPSAFVKMHTARNAFVTSDLAQLLIRKSSLASQRGKVSA